MTAEVALWIIGVGIVPLTGWIIWMISKMNKLLAQSDKLVEMHEKPDDFGFGTVSTNKHMEDQARSMRDICHLMKWFIKAQTGQSPPPRVEEM